MSNGSNECAEGVLDCRWEHPFLRFCIASFMDNTTCVCCYCMRRFENIEDVLDRNPVVVRKEEKLIIACKSCWVEHARLLGEKK